MADSDPAGPSRDPFESIISIVAGPIAAVIRSFDQLRRGSDELIKGLENFNRTMQNLNDTAERVNSLLNEFEEPARAILPQVTRTVNLAEELANRVSGPIDQVVPGLTRLADTLSSPVLTSLPNDLGSFVEAINDLVRRLAPLAQMAESAGGLFGLRIPGMSRSAPAPMLTPASEPAAQADDSGDGAQGAGQAQGAGETQGAGQAQGPGQAQSPGEAQGAAKKAGQAPANPLTPRPAQQVVAIGTSASMTTSTRRSAAISESDGSSWGPGSRRVPLPRSARRRSRRRRGQRQ